MSPYFQKCIHTRADGTHIDRPESPGTGASRDAKLTFIRAVHKYNDEVYDAGNAAFDRSFREALR